MAYSKSPIIFLLHGILLVHKTSQQENKSPQSGSDMTNIRQQCYEGKSLSSSVCLPHDYNLGEVPDIPAMIHTIFEINNIRDIDDKKMTVTFEFYQQLTWVDDRILLNLSVEETKLGGVPLTSNQLQHIWTPGLWIQSLFDFKLRSVFEPSIGLFIHKKTRCELTPGCNITESTENETSTAVTFNFEARATVFCNFNYFRYPMDTQTCDFVMSSAYPFPDIVIFKLEESQFGTTFNNSNTDDFILDITFNDIVNGFSGISCVLKLERCLLPYIMKYYLPCIAMVIVSFISFLLSLNSIPARVALLVTLFLTLTNILIAQQAESPASGNFTALGIYLCTCLFFVVASFLEFAILLGLKNSYRSRRISRIRQNGFKRPNSNQNFDENYDEEFIAFIYRIDITSLFIFACMFGIFNIFYWLRFKNW